MNKKVLLIAMVMFSVMLMVTPVLAVPTQGQKLPVSLKFTNPATTNPGTIHKTNGDIGQKRDSAGSYAVELSIDGADPIVGVSMTEVPISVYNMIKHQCFTIHEIHIMAFPTEDGGFEGNVLLRFTDVVSLVPGAFDYHLEAHGTFQGTLDPHWQDRRSERAGAR